MRRSPIQLGLVALASLGCVFAPARGEQPGSLRAAAELAPADTSVFAAVRTPMELMRTPTGEAVGRTLASFGLNETHFAFERMARELGFNGEHAARALLSERVTLVGRPAADETMHWVVETEVSREAVERIRQRLRPAPRKVASGRAILALERGRYHLAVFDRGERSVVVIAEAEADDLLLDIVRAQSRSPRNRGASDSLATSDVFRVIERLDAATDAFVFARDPSCERSWVGLSARVDERGAALEMMVQSPTLTPEDGPFRAWSHHQFDRLKDGAILAVLDRTNEEVLTLLIGDGNERAGLLPWDLPPQVAALGAQRLAMAVYPGGPVAPIELALALETDDVEAMSAVLEPVLPALVGRADASGRDASALPLRAMRTSPATGGPWSFLGWKRAPSVAWNYRVDAACNPGQQTGWWTIGLGPSSVERLSDAVSCTNEPREDESRVLRLPLLTVGVIRPTAFSREFRLGERAPEAAAVLEQIESLTWRGVRMRSDLALIQGELRLSDERVLAEEPSDDAGAASEGRVQTIEARTGRGGGR